MRKLRIAFVCDPINKHVAGSPIATIRFAKLLKKRGHKIIFIAAKDPESKRVGHIKGMKVYRFFSVLLPKTEKNFYLAFPTLTQIKKLLKKEKIDILHVILPTPAAITSVKAAASLGVKIIIHSQTQPENIFLFMPKTKMNDTLSEMFYKYMIWLYKKGEVIICPSPLSEKLLKDYDPSLNTLIISNGVDTAKFKKTSPAKFFSNYKLSKEVKNLLFVGRLNPEKGIDTLIKALPHIKRRFEKFHVYIVGIGPLKNKLEKMAENLGVRDKVSFLGRIGEHDLVLAYNACDIFVFPSIAELEGLVVLEAMSCGKPVIVSDSSNNASSNFVNRKNDNGFLFKAQDHKDLAKKVLGLLEDDSLRMKMAYQSYRKSRKYDINCSASALEKAYYDVIRK